jgi:hypothetical protein
MTMIGIFGPRWERGQVVQRIDTEEYGTLTEDELGDYVGVTWDAGGSSWVRAALLRIVEIQMT